MVQSQHGPKSIVVGRRKDRRGVEVSIDELGSTVQRRPVTKEWPQHSLHHEFAAILHSATHPRLLPDVPKIGDIGE